MASLLASDPNKYDDLGESLQSELFDVFRRQREEGVQPVSREEVVEVLRRRLFEADSLRDTSAQAAQVIGVVGALARLDAATKKNRRSEEERFRRSYPFHPELGDVFYSRWTQLSGFQRTRGILRTLAIALREAEHWDACPAIGPAALLAAPGTDGVSDAVADLAGIARSEQYEGPRTDWRPLLEKELQIARKVQEQVPALDQREAEQAVVAVFLHSQPIGHKANTPELVRIIGSGAPDGIELEKALGGWRDLSWFLDDADAVDEDTGSLPKSWRLGNRPNLKQMHDEACAQRVSSASVEQRLEEEIRRTRRLTEGVSGTGARPHVLPKSPRDLPDNGEFRYALLGPEAASDSGKPNPKASQYLAETTGPDRPRVFRNVVVAAAPSRDGIAAARDAVRSLLGWEDVQAQLDRHSVDPLQGERLRKRLSEARQRVPDTIRAAWCIVVSVNEEGQVQAFKLPGDGGPLFAQIKADARSRIKETAVDAEALLPDGPYDLWQENDEARFVSELTRAFARNPRLPKVLKANVVVDTVVQGIQRGLLVARLSRPDGSSRTWWREVPPEQAIADDQLEVVLPEKAALTALARTLLEPDRLPSLWNENRATLGEVIAYFGGGHTVTVPLEGYDEVETIPYCEPAVVREAVRGAVEAGLVWLTDGPTSLWREPVPDDVLTKDAQLRPRPAPIPPAELLEEALPDAWHEGRTNGADLTRALSQARKEPVPWGLVRESMLSGVDTRWLQVKDGDAVSPDTPFRDAGQVVLVRPLQTFDPTPPEPSPPAALLEGHQIQDLAELLPELMEASAGHQLKFRVQIVLEDAPPEIRTKVDQLIDSRLKSEPDQAP